MDKSIYTQSEILAAISDSFAGINAFFEEITEHKLEANQGEKWSIKEEFEHLILSNKPVSSALKLPKLVLRSFGKPRNPSRNFEAIIERYHQKLKTDAVVAAAAGYAPKKSDKLTKEEMLSSWQIIAEKFEARIKKWSEEKLDQYLLPHPLLGKLTIREMLFFTIYHNQHHLNSMKAKVDLV